MMQYQVPWIFHMSYDHKKRDMKIMFSNQFVLDNHIESSIMILDDDQIKRFIHKYDYRKLEYFVSQELPNPFDTFMRFSIPNQKTYIRTQAVCHLDRQLLRCVMFDEKTIFTLQNITDSQAIIDALPDLEKIESVNQTTRWTKHLNLLIHRGNENELRNI
jgi:hypothetical protein